MAQTCNAQTRKAMKVTDSIRSSVRVLLTGVALAGCCFTATVQAAPDGTNAGAAPGAALVERLQALRPDVPIERVSPSPVPGIVTLDLGGGTVFYGTEDGRYLFAGDLFELTDTDLVNVAEAGRMEMRRERLAKVDSDSMIIFPAKGPVRQVITVFTDVDCGYCQKLHSEVPELNAMGIEVRYLGYPRAGIGSESYDRIVSAWCADNPNEALTRVKAGEDIPAATCDNPIAEQYGLGREIGVVGTPAIVLPNGELLPGYLPARELAAAIGVPVE